MKPNTACSFTIFKISSPLEGFTKGFNGAKNTLLTDIILGYVKL
jgi:hypothetical protein